MDTLLPSPVGFVGGEPERTLPAGRPRPRTSGADGRLAVDDVDSVHRRGLAAVEGVDVGLKHEHGAPAGDRDRLLCHGALLTVRNVGATDLPLSVDALPLPEPLVTQRVLQLGLVDVGWRFGCGGKVLVPGPAAMIVTAARGNASGNAGGAAS